MDELKVVGFTSYDDPTYPTINAYGEKLDQVFATLIEYFEESQEVYSAQDYQNRPDCVPVFSDGTAFRCSMRMWAQIMAKAYFGDSDTYMDFYMEVPEDVEPIYPDAIAKVPPSEEPEGRPYVTKADMSIMIETFVAGADFYTTDKALLVAWPIFREILKQKFGQQEEQEEEE